MILDLLMYCAIAAATVASLALCILVYRVAFPLILSFPWSTPPENSRRRKREKEMTVVFAGSFNPPHWGHLVMLRYLADRYGRVICCIGVNPTKNYAVSPQVRAQILQDMLVLTTSGACNNVQVAVVTGYIWRYARTQHAALFFRGVRTWTTDGPEERHLQILNSWGPLLLGRIWPLRTIFLEGDPRYRDVSSTRTRTICDEIRRIRKDHGTDVKHSDDDNLSRLVDELVRLVPECVIDRIVEAYGMDA